MINTDYAVAMFAGGVFNRPYREVQGEDGLYYTPIPPHVFRTMDLSRIRSFGLSSPGGERLRIELADGTVVIFCAMRRPDAL